MGKGSENKVRKISIGCLARVPYSAISANNGARHSSRFFYVNYAQLERYVIAGLFASRSGESTIPQYLLPLTQLFVNAPLRAEA